MSVKNFASALTLVLAAAFAGCTTTCPDQKVTTEATEANFCDRDPLACSSQSAEHHGGAGGQGGSVWIPHAKP